MLTDFSLAGDRACAYAAALAAPLGAELHLMHVFAPLPITALEYGLMPPLLDVGYGQEFRQSLENSAAALPVPATAEVSEAG